MKDKSYSEKEVAILKGMINLIKGGANPYSIKVSDIAESAGVGKGTIYDYFETKEEVIVKAIIFNTEKEMDLLTERVYGKSVFKEKYYEILYFIVENLRNKFSTFNILASAGKLPGCHKNQFHKMDYHNRFSKIQCILDDLLATGFKEGTIKEIEGAYYQKMVIQSAMFAFGNYMAMKHLHLQEDISMEEAMDYSYKMVVKALN